MKYTNPYKQTIRTCKKIQKVLTKTIKNTKENTKSKIKENNRKNNEPQKNLINNNQQYTTRNTKKTFEK